MMSEDKLVKELQKITNRLEAVIGIPFENAGRTEKFSLKERIKILDSCGLSPTEIAKTVGTSDNYVNVQLSLMRKGSNKLARIRSKER